jgi:CRP/FNR family transcriptional regulator, anaerobic regulatory protein
MDTIEADLIRQLNFLSDVSLQEEVLNNGELLQLKKGDVIVKEGQQVKFLPIVLKGSIRVFQKKEDREVLLYYVRPEQTCTMSMAAAYFDNKSSSFGIANEPTEVLVFPSQLITEWQLRFPSWNRYVMRMFRTRYDELVKSLENIAFEHIDVRVMEYLKNKVEQDSRKVMNISHQRLANELGTTRVVVSRILKQLEHDKKIKLSRSAIQVL